MSALDTFFDEIVAGTDAILLFSPDAATVEEFEAEDTPVVVVDRENEIGADQFVELPLPFRDVTGRLRFGLEGAIRQGFVDEGDTTVCVTSVFEDGLDAAVRVESAEFTQTGLYNFFVNSRADPSVVRDVFEVAIELGRKGQKGKPVGALFVVGDAGKVMNKSRPLSYNPFEKSHVHVGDPIVNVMLKEFSRLDGAFVISDSGKIVSAYRYLEPSAEGVDIPKGLGARHMAAGAITRDTSAIAIVLSESDGMVRAFKGGEIVLELDPEAY
jgi:DNA integrity scanning protein DisA with diadenylate cyclase activity